MQHTRFLLNIETSSRPITFNHYFAANLNRCKLLLLEKDFKVKAKRFQVQGAYTGGEFQQAITLADLRSMTVEKNMCNAILI
jgi:hypothetical protein